MWRDEVSLLSKSPSISFRYSLLDPTPLTPELCSNAFWNVTPGEGMSSSLKLRRVFYAVIIPSLLNACTNLLLGDLDLARLDVIGDVLGAAAVNLAAGGESSTEDLLNGTLQVLGEGLEAHGASNVDDLIKGNALGVLDVLLLLPVTRGLLKSLDDKRRGGGND